jgi:hypothetical protein
MASILKLDTLQSLSGAKALDVNKLAADTAPRYIRQSVREFNSNNYTFTTTWGAGPVMAALPLMKAGSLVKLFYHCPLRNDATTWGGAYVEPQIAINGTWFTLGSSGYDGVMVSGNPVIGHYANTLLLDPTGVTLGDFTCQFRFYLRSYDGTLWLNTNHDINGSISGTAAGGNMPSADNTNVNQHFMHTIVEELALLK